MMSPLVAITYKVPPKNEHCERLSHPTMKITLEVTEKTRDKNPYDPKHFKMQI